jgi:hypothetical protein
MAHVRQSTLSGRVTTHGAVIAAMGPKGQTHALHAF